MRLSFSPSTPNGVCLASFHRVYQWDHEASPLTKDIPDPPLNVQLPVTTAVVLNNSEVWPSTRQG